MREVRSAKPKSMADTCWTTYTHFPSHLDRDLHTPHTDHYYLVCLTDSLLLSLPLPPSTLISSLLLSFPTLYHQFPSFPFSNVQYVSRVSPPLFPLKIFILILIIFFFAGKGLINGKLHFSSNGNKEFLYHLFSIYYITRLQVSCAKKDHQEVYPVNPCFTSVSCLLDVFYIHINTHTHTQEMESVSSHVSCSTTTSLCVCADRCNLTTNVFKLKPQTREYQSPYLCVSDDQVWGKCRCAGHALSYDLIVSSVIITGQGCAVQACSFYPEYAGEHGTNSDTRKTPAHTAQGQWFCIMWYKQV